MKVNEMFLISDLDGTIIPAGGSASQKNIEAIEKFKSLGGTFTIATGRSPIAAKKYSDMLNVYSPIICSNGAQIYDTGKQEHLWAKKLPDYFVDIIENVIKSFPNSVGVEVIDCKDNYFTVYSSDYLERVFKNDTIVHTKIDLKDLPKDCISVLFLIDHDMFEAVTEEILKKDYKDVTFVKSGGDCFEMIATGVNKAAPFEEIVKIYNKKMSDTIAIGDFYNDIEMITKAKFGVTLENGVNEVKEKADLVVKSCENDGLADLISYLIDNADKI